MEIDLSVIEFGDRIRLLRNLKGYTKTELAEKVGITYNYLFKLENRSKKNPSMNVIEHLAKALNVSAGELLGDK